MDWKEKKARAAQLFNEVRAILDDPDATDEQKEHIPAMIADAQQLKAEVLQMREIEEAGKELAAAVEVEQKEQKLEQAAQMAPPDVGAHETLGEFLHDIKLWAMGLKKDTRLRWFDDEKGHEVELKDMVENVGASGGFLVPTEYLAQLFSVMQESSFIRSRATKIPMRRRSISMPVLDQTGTTAGRPHWFGGMVFYWAEEAAEKTESDPTFRKVTLTAHKLIGYTRASDELVDDSAISLEAFLTGPTGFAGGATWHEEYSFLRGTGAGQPLGVINAGATITVARAAGGPTIGYADLVNMLESFYPGANPTSTTWSFTQTAMSNLFTIQDAAGNYIWQPNAQRGAPNMLLGYPVVFTEKQPAVGTSGDVVLADWAYYMIGDRQAITIESTQFDRWRYDETSWRMVHRVDGQPWLSAPLTYEDGSTQVSPFVILGDKST
jgi:HK97 family phage major capsid protein